MISLHRSARLRLDRTSTTEDGLPPEERNRLAEERRLFWSRFGVGLIAPGPLTVTISICAELSARSRRFAQDRLQTSFRASFHWRASPGRGRNSLSRNRPALRDARAAVGSRTGAPSTWVPPASSNAFARATNRDSVAVRLLYSQRAALEGDAPLSRSAATRCCSGGAREMRA
jgi:hypothetical protein